MIKVGSLVKVYNDIYSAVPEYIVGYGIIVDEQECLVYNAYIPGTDTYGDVVAKQYKVLVGEEFQWHGIDTIKEMA